MFKGNLGDIIKQAQQLVEFGIDPRELYFDRAQELLQHLRHNRQRSVEQLRRECRAMGARFFDDDVAQAGA